MAYVLWQRHLKHNPRDPQWPDRDRFVLSAGHGCMLLYCLLHLTGYDLTLDDLKAVPPVGKPDAGPPRVAPDAGRRGDDRAARPGHGQRRRHGDRGALARRAASTGPATRSSTTARSRSSRDGDLMEGISSRGRRSLAGHLEARQAPLPLRRQPRHARRARRRVASPRTSRAATRPTAGRSCASRTATRTSTAIDAAIRTARLAGRRGRRSSSSRTTIGYGSPHKAGTSRGARQPARRRRGRADQEGARLGVDRAVLRCRRRPLEALPHGGRARRRRREARLGAAVRGVREGVSRTSPRSGALRGKGELPDGLGRGAARSGRPGETRRRASAGGKAMNAIAEHVPWLVGGDADLSDSTKTKLEGAARASTAATGAGRQPPLRRPRARDGRRSPTAWRTTAACGPSSRRSSASPTTCGRPCASRRSERAARRSSSGRTTRSASARTARRTSRSST